MVKRLAVLTITLAIIATLLHQRQQSVQRRLNQRLALQISMYTGDGPEGVFTRSYGKREMGLTIQYWLAKGADPRTTDPDGITVLMTAADLNDLVLLRKAVAAGVPIDKQCRGGWSALMWGSSAGSVQAVQELLALGANPALRNDEGKTALEMAHGAEVARLQSWLLWPR